LLFAGLLVVGRAASGGQIVWLPAFHANPTPLIVILNTSKPATPPALPKTLPGDPAAAISKKSAASEVITFSPGKNSGKGDGLAQPDAIDSGTSAAGTVSNETGSSDNGSGGSVGTGAAETNQSDVQGSSGTQGTAGNETSNSDVQGQRIREFGCAGLWWKPGDGRW
jgi:hypothetical protein